MTISVGAGSLRLDLGWFTVSLSLAEGLFGFM